MSTCGSYVVWSINLTLKFRYALCVQRLIVFNMSYYIFWLFAEHSRINNVNLYRALVTLYIYRTHR